MVSQRPPPRRDDRDEECRRVIDRRAHHWRAQSARDSHVVTPNLLPRHSAQWEAPCKRVSMRAGAPCGHGRALPSTSLFSFIESNPPPLRPSLTRTRSRPLPPLLLGGESNRSLIIITSPLAPRPLPVRSSSPITHRPRRLDDLHVPG
eukprot:GHVU01085635.1.p3 GENE.GHVU01085635.1~~GHVU01085635.1.p3  ORF type:complete len:148 (+),score=8.45 GHVU01085635.1:545-988(+)